MVEKTNIDALFEQGKTEELIPLLEKAIEEEYEEYNMLKLGQCYLISGDEKKAKKIIRRLKMLFPSGDYYMEEDILLDAISKGTTETYIEKYCAICEVKESKRDESQRDEPTKETIDLTKAVSQIKKKEKKEVKIAESIKEYFEDVVGLHSVQIELDKFYKLLRFQNERMQNDFHAELLKSTHFVIGGARGCGKTLVGQVISNLLYDFGVREDNEPIYAEARELLNAFESDKTEGIAKLFEKINDRTIIIENIQDMLEDSSIEDGSLKSLLVCLEKVLKERREELSIIITGSIKAIEKMKALNSTIEDMINTTIEIPSYSTLELLQIAEKLANSKAFRIHQDGKKVLIRKIDLERRSPEFMNSITLNRYFDQAALKMAQRYFEKVDTTEADMVYLMPADFEMELEDESLEDIIEELNQLVGLQSVKEQVKKRIDSTRIEQEIKNTGASRKGGYNSLHLLFTGNPGTGKTTVARMIGRIYQQLGILPRGNRVVECTRSNLVGQYQGHTAKLVQEKFKEAAGGILFIDEAYALCRDNQDTFGQEAVDEIIAQMENNRDSMVVILAGYKKEMEAFLKTNSGFESRIRNKIDFEDYTVDEMVKIFKCMVKGKHMQLNIDTSNALKQMLEEKSKVINFGNARGVRNLFDEIIETMDERLLGMKAMGIPVTKNQYDIICKEDIELVAGRKTGNEKTLDELLEEVRSLTGLAGVKEKVQEMVDDLQVREMMKAHGMSAEQQGTMHLIFKGNAGTGKTTVARLLGKIYTKLGILRKNVFVEVSRGELVANYSGQTATKVLNKLEEAEGGILFIDEVYTLINGENDEFGKEAINTLVAELENRRNDLMVIIAGYGDKIDDFLSVNQGLASRLSNEIVFEDYSDEELTEIFCYMTAKKHLILEDGVKELVQEKIKLEKSGKKDYGNARGVRNMLEHIERRKNSRIASKNREGKEILKTELITIGKEDVE